jgi:tetratricopeptide (TPR) repeat protein
LAHSADIKEPEKKATDSPSQVAELNRLSFEERNVNPKHSAELAEQALKIAEQNGDVKGQADSKLNLGFSYMQQADHEKSFEQLLSCLVMYEKLGDEKAIANAQYNLGILNVRVGNFSEGIEVLHKSLLWREKHDDKNGMAACYFQIAYINVHFNDLDDAKEAAEKSLVLRKELNDEVGISAALMILGDVLVRQKNFPEAKIALAESLRLREKSTERLGYYATLIRWCEFHIETKEFEKAVELILMGMSKTKIDGIPYGMMRFHQLMGKVKYELQDYPGSKIELEEALKLAQQLSFKSVAYDIHFALWEIFEKEGDFKCALDHYKKFHSLKEEVISMQSNTKLKSVQFMSQVALAQKEAEFEKEKNAELQKAYSIIEDKQKEILDSIKYAQRIQRSQLPSEKYISKYLDNL